MYELHTFIHIIGFIIWMGLLVALAIFLPMLKNQLDTDLGRNVVCKVIRIFNALTFLSAIAVLVSGIFRVVIRWGDIDKPFWLLYMEMGGGMIVLLAIVVMALLGRRVTKPLSSRSGTVDTADVKKRLSTYIAASVLILLLVVSVVFVVSYRF